MVCICLFHIHTNFSHLSLKSTVSLESITSTTTQICHKKSESIYSIFTTRAACEQSSQNETSVCLFVYVCVQAGVLAEGSLKRLTSRAARISCVNRTIYNIYTQHIHWNTCQYLTFTSYTILQSEAKQCCEANFCFFPFT